MLNGDSENVELAKAIVLDMLSIDDESLDILLDEVPTREDLKFCLKAPFDEILLHKEDVKNALRQLVEDKMVMVLDEKGTTLEYDDLNTLLECEIPYYTWFQMTTRGKELYEITLSEYWREDDRQ